MTMQEKLQRLVDEFNDQAKAEGRYLDKDFWEIPRASGSILDAPATPESCARIANLRNRIAELNRATKNDQVPVREIQLEIAVTDPDCKNVDRPEPAQVTRAG